MGKLMYSQECPLISIIIPVYNEKKYIERCVDSVINQTYKNLEIIIVDDGSNDGSEIIVDNYKSHDNRITVIHKSYGGVSDARNVGINKANGEYVGFVDSDDFISKNMYQTLLENSIRYDCDISCCQFHKFNSNCAEQDSYKNDCVVYSAEEAIADYFKIDKVWITVWSKLYKRKLFDNIEFPVGKLFEDEYVFCKLLYLSKKIVVTNSILYYYYKNENSISNNYTLNSWNQYFEASEIQRSYAEKLGYQQYHFNRVFLASFFYKRYCNQNEYKKLRKAINKDLRTIKHLNSNKRIKLKLFIQMYFFKTNMKIGKLLSFTKR